jgi:hypothetical protein
VAVPNGDEALAAARADADEDDIDLFDPSGGEPATEVADRPRRPSAPSADHDTGEDATEVATRERRPASVGGDPGETVRVLGARRPRRTGEGTPAEAAPGTAAIGARHIEPGQAPRRSAAAAWLARLLAFAALVVVVVALLLVVKPF